MPLTDIAIKTAQPGGKPVKMFDAGGLFLIVTPGGGKWWRWRYHFGGKEKLLSLGTYPDVPLRTAREKRDENRRLLAAGIDPGENRKIQKRATVERASNSFEVLAREWFAKEAPGMAPGHADHLLTYLEKDIFPWIGGKPVAEILPADILPLARRVEARGAIETAHRVVGVCGRVFRYAVGSGRAPSDPTRDLQGLLQKKPRPKHFAAMTDPAKVGGLLRAIEGFPGGIVVRSALRVAPFVFVRPGELRAAEWKDFNLEAAEWRFLATKTTTPHVVPLARQAVAILRDLQPVTGGGRFVFPSARSPLRPMSNGAILAALRSMGITGEEMTGHGFRAIARTLLHEVLNYRPEVIERQLAHDVPDPNGTAYNRTQFLEERRKMMQDWADYLDRLRAGA